MSVGQIVLLGIGTLVLGLGLGLVIVHARLARREHTWRDLASQHQMTAQAASARIAKLETELDAALSALKVAEKAADGTAVAEARAALHALQAEYDLVQPELAALHQRISAAEQELLAITEDRDRWRARAESGPTLVLMEQVEQVAAVVGSPAIDAGETEGSVRVAPHTPRPEPTTTRSRRPNGRTGRARQGNLPERPSRRPDRGAGAGNGQTSRDDLKAIRGIGPVLEEKLNRLGIVSFAQLAALDEDQIDGLAGQLQSFGDRIRRDGWVTQAATLSAQQDDRRIS